MNSATPAHGYEAVYRKKGRYSDDEVHRLPVNAWSEIGEALVADPRGFLTKASTLTVQGCPFVEVVPFVPGPADVEAALRRLASQISDLGETILVAARMNQQ